MDSFDDFEMKPITEGLGFHKKKVDLDKNKVTSEEQQVNELMTALDEVSIRLKDHLKDDADIVASKSTNFGLRENKQKIEIFEPLPRTSPAAEKKAQNLEIPFERVPEIIPDVDSIRPSTEKRSEPSLRQTPAQNVGTRRGAADSPLPRLRPVGFSVPSAVVDLMVVVALALFFLVSLLTVTEVSLATVYAGMQKDLMTQLSMALLYIAVLQMYVIVARSFFGKTLGEWTFDLQMGSNEQIQSSVYPLLVLWRSFIVVVTGVIFLPLLSVLFGKDIASYLTGLQLYRSC